jgi:nicotinate-nucleotide pyrophosphorylase (carboxylating)
MKIDFLGAFIENAIREDVGAGDHTSLATIPEDATGRAHLLIKGNGILAGMDIAQRVFEHIDNSLMMEPFHRDGSPVKNGDFAFIISGKVQSILKAERLVLNIMQRMSGIATETHKYCEKISGFKTKVIDTRKTTPGMRYLEKEAVRIGGGDNHRMGLYDMILIKDNHIDFSGSIENAIQKTKDYLKKTGKKLKIEIEARNLDEVKRIVALGGVHWIMLDNFNINDTKKAIEIIGGRYEVESSGGITLETIRDYAECGVNAISVGALTNQTRTLDLSLKAIK